MGGTKVPVAGKNGTWESVFQQIREALKGMTRTGFQRGDIILRLQRGAEVLPVAAILRRARRFAKGPHYAGFSSAV